MKLYVITNREFNIFYQPEISCSDAVISEIPYIFDKEPYYLGDKLYDNTWLDNSLEKAQEEFPEVKWESIEIMVKQV